jgi:hypothetical protein
MSFVPGGGSNPVSSSSPLEVAMDDAGEAPDMNHIQLNTAGVIPQLPPHVQGLPPAPLLSNVPELIPAIPSRMQILQEALQLCTATPSSRDDKMDLLLSMMTSMFKLMLLDHVAASGGSSPLSLRLSSSDTGTTASSNGGPSSPNLGPNTSASTVIVGAHLQASQPNLTGTAGNADVRMPGQSLAAAAHFRCPTCPPSKAPLTEKSFNKHILAWKQKVRSGVGASRKVKSGSCSGIRCLDHPLVAGLSGRIEERVDQVVDHTMSLLSPGASAAHTPGGTGNFRQVQAYFDQLVRGQFVNGCGTAGACD